MPAKSSDAQLRARIATLYATDAQFASARPDPAITEEIERAGTRLADMVAIALTGYADRPALGQRRTRLVTDPATGRATLELLPVFDTITYRELWARTTALTAALTAARVGPGDRVCVLGFTSIDYATVSLALLRLGVVTVPLQTSAPAAELGPIVEETDPRVIATAVENLSQAVHLAAGSSHPVLLVVFDYRADVDDQREIVEAAERIARESGHVVLETLSDLLTRGAGLPDPPPIAGTDSDPLTLLTYTSGSTGTPKGVMYTERIVANDWRRSGRAAWGQDNAEPSIVLCFLPMSHGMGRGSLYWALSTGGTAYFTARSDLSMFIEDLALVRPTQLGFVPRVWDMLRQQFDGDTDAFRTHVLGGRFVSAMVSSAPMTSELRDWVETHLELTVCDGYGSTECGAVTVNGRVKRPPVIDYSLVDVAELGYFVTDSPPRGELLIKSHNMFTGYYRRPDITAEVLDDDGWYHTGDVVAEVEPDHLVYVDRRTNVLKLAQGEFVTVSKLEAIFGDSPLIRQIYLYGASTEAFLLAVVVPTDPGGDQSALRAALRASMREIARDAGLQPYEIPRDFIVEAQPFTLENGLLTGVRKLARPKLRRRYAERIDRLYADLAQRTDGVDTGVADVARPVLDVVRDTAKAVLGVEESIPGDTRFVDLGGDSLSTLMFARRLEQSLGIGIPVGLIVSPTTTLASLADFIVSARESGPAPSLFVEVHGSAPRTAYAKQITPDRFIDGAVLENAATLPTARGVGTVLLTGATGFLGRYLALEIADRLPVDGRLICLVREGDAGAARARLEAVFAGDARLHDKFERAAHRLEVVAGDRSLRQFGLDDDAWAGLAADVDLIVDAGALVNHVLPYEEMFAANVVGTAEVITLALTTKRKQYAYVSTTGIGEGVAHADFTEDADIRDICPSRPVDDSYANGYTNAKWADEVLLRGVNELCGLPTVVFRCGMILADTTYSGQLNLPDVFTRLIHSVVATGLAPESFCELDAGGQRRRDHYDGLPVEFVAESIAALCAGAGTGLQTYHVVNHHDDGVGLDTYIDWLVEAGCDITRITPYRSWFDRFETALHAMPEQRRRMSVLPLLHNYRTATPVKKPAHSERFRAAVGEVPAVTPELIANYVRELASAGML